MHKQSSIKIKWQEPIKAASHINNHYADFAFLYSGQQLSHSGQYSFLAFDKKDEAKGNRFTVLAEKLDNNKNDYWFGYFGYELKHDIEKLPFDEDSYINMPALWFAAYNTVVIFDHKKKSAVISGKYYEFPKSGNIKIKAKLETTEIHSNMSKQQYLTNVAKIKKNISKGVLYQANLTRKFYGKITNNNPFLLFSRLCKISPSAYSSLLKFGDYAIISSSPERFLHLDAKGKVNTMPIKGSAARSKNKQKDIWLKSKLASSNKDKAENLMIVDLSRNDLSRNCKLGSVKVEKLFEIVSNPTIHHMVSTISGIKNDNVSNINLIRGCFPPGSMTGTPKIKAMEICSKLEKQKRGVYSGAIGYFAPAGNFDFSVVIRTIIIQKDKFEFQVGGAIVADSIAEDELLETQIKASAICQALGVRKAELI